MRPLLSLLADGMASPEETRVLEQHLAECAECRSAYDWMLATRQVLAARPAAVPPDSMSLKIRAALANERNAEARRVVRFRTVYQPALAMAATAVIAALCFSLFHRTPDRINPHPVVVAIQPNPEETLPKSEMPVPVAPTVPAKHGAAAPVRLKPRPIHHPDIEHFAQIPASEKPLKLIAPPVVSSAPVVAKAHPTELRKTILPVRHNMTVAHVTPTEHNEAPPVKPVIPHPNETVATNKTPDTPLVTPAPQPPAIVPAPPEHVNPEPRPTVVASSSVGNSLLAGVRAHVENMQLARASLGERITRATAVRVADYTTALDSASHAESCSGTEGIVSSGYK